MGHLYLGFLASHGGSNMQAIIDAYKSGQLNATPKVVISNNEDAVVLERARKEGIPAYILNRKIYSSSEELDNAILVILQKHKVDLVILAGYMRMLGKKTLAYYKNRILNIHPALLPKFGGKGMYGHFVHEAVISAKEKKSGVTIHLVDDRYDHGTIVAQEETPVLEDDTPDSLAERVLELEHKIYTETLKKISTGEIDLDKIAADNIAA